MKIDAEVGPRDNLGQKLMCQPGSEGPPLASWKYAIEIATVR